MAAWQPYKGLMKRFVYGLMAMVVAAGMLVSVAAEAFSGKPLMVIRFNQRKVYFEQPLYAAATKAINKKSGVVFNLISYVPIAGNPDQDEALMQRAGGNLREVTAALVKMGIPPQQVTTNTQPGQGLNYDEVHIYVQ